MSAQLPIARTLVAAVAALLVSSVAIGSAVGPAQVALSSSKTVNA